MNPHEGRDWQLFLTTAIENANDAVILYHVESERNPFLISYVNRTFEQQTGYTRDEALGRSTELLFGPLTDRQTVASMRDGILALKPVTGELQKYRKDGSTFWCEMNIRPLIDERGALFGAVAIQRDITVRKKTHDQLDRTRKLLDAIMENTKNVVYAKDLEGRYLFVNAEFERLHNKPARTIVGKTDFDLFPHDHAEAFRVNDRRALESGVAITEEERAPSPAGVQTFLSIKFALSDADGKPYATCGVSTNITAQAEAHRQLRLLELALDHTRDAIAVFRLDDADGQWRICYANAALTKMTGHSNAELLGQSSDFFIGPDTDADAIRADREALKAGREIQTEWLAYRKDGSSFNMELNASPLSDEGDSRYTIVVYRDVTAKKRREELLSYEASHDPLTGAFNRRYLERSLELAIVDARERNTEHGLIYLDLDGFKAINDRYGHEGGDNLLTALTILMSSRLRRGDILARLGGDEFAALLFGCSLEQTQRIAEELLAAIAAFSYPFEGSRLSCSSSAGIAQVNASSTTARQALRLADDACYTAKRNGKNQVAFSIL